MRSRRRRGDEDDETRLGRVRHRGQRVRGEHREGHRLAEALVPGLGERHRRADEKALHDGESHIVEPDSTPLRDQRRRPGAIFTDF